MNRRIELDNPHAGGAGQGAELRGAWLIGPLLVAAVGAGTLFVFRGPDHLFGIAFGLVLGLGFLWILVSTLFPAKPDRTCPECGSESLGRLDPDSTRGLSCSACSWSDATASSFYFAEEEGGLEDLALRDRQSDARPRRW